jgi:hypothetical protein
VRRPRDAICVTISSRSAFFSSESGWTEPSRSTTRVLTASTHSLAPLLYRRSVPLPWSTSTDAIFFADEKPYTCTALVLLLAPCTAA